MYFLAGTRSASSGAAGQAWAPNPLLALRHPVPRPSCDHTPPAAPLHAGCRQGHMPQDLHHFLRFLHARPPRLDARLELESADNRQVRTHRGEKTGRPRGETLAVSGGLLMAATGEVPMAAVKCRRSSPPTLTPSPSEPTETLQTPNATGQPFISLTAPRHLARPFHFTPFIRGKWLGCLRWGPPGPLPVDDARAGDGSPRLHPAVHFVRRA
jgi:hypothetical protein